MNTAITQTFVELLFLIAFGSHKILYSELHKFSHIEHTANCVFFLKIVLNYKLILAKSKSKVGSSKVIGILLVCITNGSQGRKCYPVYTNHKANSNVARVTNG